ncbi:methionine ABC transporter permease [Hyalangium rubrum]|uniref:Methionine ABC transporter permease n=1 Tax=Hyalangium rubrum TaxID=3103134 RepID=A0ABU5H443_9BACT|nr:methionine ABC transporter permease [Hyalangium sp. s54d21]MDY7228245.1 methionine ABC transporter permease [Hyalangium sp. s54d21]
MSAAMLELLWKSFLETLVMVGVSSVLAVAAGLPLGVGLLLTAPGHLYERPWLHRGLALIVNATRSTPFIILMVSIIPLTRLLVGTAIGTRAAIVPLALAAAPFVARLFEAALKSVDRELIDAARSLGATRWQIVWKVLLHESLPGLVAATTVMVISLIGSSAMAGAVGGGGLGDLGIRYGYQRFQPWVMAAVVVVLMGLVNAIQLAGDVVARRLSRK